MSKGVFGWSLWKLVGNALYIRIFNILLHNLMNFILVEYQCIKMKFPYEDGLLKGKEQMTPFSGKTRTFLFVFLSMQLP